MSAKPSYEELEKQVRELEKRTADLKKTEDALQKSLEQLQRSEDELKSIFRAAPTGIGVVCDRVFTQANDRLCEMVLFSKEELIGKNARILYPTDQEYEYVGMEKYGQIRDKGTGTVVTRWQRKDGEVIDVLLSSTPIDLKDFSKGVTFTALDITNRMQAEQALRESEGKYRNILESIEDGYFEVDIAGNFMFFNQSMCRILGYGADEMMGMNNREYMDSENARKVFQIFNTVFRTGNPTKALDWKLIRKDGSECFVATTVSLITDSNGSRIGFRGIARDVTEQKRLEANLQQAQKMEAIGTLTGGIAHDFNNIMGIILGNAELALDDVPRWNSAYFNLEEIKTAGLRAKDIVRQLLSFSRKADHKLMPIKIVPVIRDALKFLRSTIPTTIDIHQNIQAQDETVLADPTQINQIMMNLCINASHAMEQKGGNLTINVKKIAVDEQSTGVFPDLKPGDYVELTVSDTGMGIDPGIRDKIFDPYFTTKEVGKGSGMGLAVVHGIVSDLRGAVFVESSPGNGASFHIVLPLTMEKSEAAVKTTEKLPTGNETILFVDDEESIVILVRQILERLGYQVETTMNPEEALEIFRLKPDTFNLVITDMTMPRMNGFALLKKLKEIRKEVPVIICSGYSDLMDEKKAAEFCMAAYVMKPISMRELAETVRKVLDESEKP